MPGRQTLTEQARAKKTRGEWGLHETLLAIGLRRTGDSIRRMLILL